MSARLPFETDGLKDGPEGVAGGWWLVKCGVGGPWLGFIRAHQQPCPDPASERIECRAILTSNNIECTQRLSFNLPSHRRRDRITNGVALFDLSIESSLATLGDDETSCRPFKKLNARDR